MGVFEFVIILVLIVTVGEAATKIMVPISKRVAEYIAESIREKRALREGGAAPPGHELPGEAIVELEERLARIEDRLDFIEELKAPERRPGIGSPKY